MEVFHITEKDSEAVWSLFRRTLRDSSTHKLLQRRYIRLVHQSVLSNLNSQYSGLYYEVLILCFCNDFRRRFIICSINKYR